MNQQVPALPVLNTTGVSFDQKPDWQADNGKGDFMGLRVPLFWRFQLVGWFVFSVFSFPLKWVILEDIPGSIAISLYRDGLGFLLTLGMREIYRRAYREDLSKLILVGLIALVSLAGGLILTYFSLAFHHLFAFEEEKIFTTAVTFAIFYFRTGLCFFWSLLYFGFRLVQESTEKDARLARVVAEHREIELQMLRAQMNPHLLANALTNILVGLGQQLPKVAAMVQALANYLNYSLIHQKDDFVTMSEEYEALMDFLTLENVLFGKKLNVGCRIDESTRSFKVPGVILQPLVENAVKYGLQTCPPPVVIRLVIGRAESDLVIEVSNTGHWVDLDEERTAGRVGLQNIRRRLRWLYGDKHKIEILAEEGWVIIRILLPIQP